jgi:hypothetical protein
VGAYVWMISYRFSEGSPGTERGTVMLMR